MCGVLSWDLMGSLDNLFVGPHFEMVVAILLFAAWASVSDGPASGNSPRIMFCSPNTHVPHLPLQGMELLQLATSSFED